MAKILIVEDSDLLNQAYSFMLNAKGHQVVSAFDGMEGLQKAAEFDPEIILLDYLMPKLDGKGFLEAYNVPKNHPTVRVLLLTNLSDEDKLQEALDLGIPTYWSASQFILNTSNLTTIIAAPLQKINDQTFAEPQDRVELETSLFYHLHYRLDPPVDPHPHPAGRPMGSLDLSSDAEADPPRPAARPRHARGVGGARNAPGSPP